jgi:hypothetical protein
VERLCKLYPISITAMAFDFGVIYQYCFYVDGESIGAAICCRCYDADLF